MGHLLGVVDQEKLDEQRGVVQNENVKEKINLTEKLLQEFLKLHSEGHPYSWSVIGSMEDLDISLEDVQEWFKTYRAYNAVLALAGDIDLETARKGKQLAISPQDHLLLSQIYG